MDEVYTILELAERVVKTARKLGINVKIQNLQNPRIEKEEHYYEVDHEHLRKLGFKPIRALGETLDIMLKDLSKYKDRVLEKSQAILPKTPGTDLLSMMLLKPIHPFQIFKQNQFLNAHT